MNAAKDALDGAITTFTNARNAGKKVPGSVTYTFSGLPVDETITLSAASALSWTNNTSLTVSVSETFNAYEWYIDGVVVSGQTTQSITLQARTYRVGVHTLTLRVQKDGVWYTKS